MKQFEPTTCTTRKYYATTTLRGLLSVEIIILTPEK
jgi:hypothetical protein